MKLLNDHTSEQELYWFIFEWVLKAETHDATRHGDLSLSVPWLWQGCLRLFCRCIMSHEIKPVWIRATDHSDKILWQRQWVSHVTRGDLSQQPVAAMCSSDLSHRVSEPLGKAIGFSRQKKNKRFLHKHPETLNMIFGFLPDAERICTIMLVCKKWYDIVYSCALRRKVDFDFQRRLTSDALGKFVFPRMRKIFLSECHNLDSRDLCHILCRCRNLEVLVLAWIGYRKQTVPSAFTEALNFERLRFLQLSHCKVTSSLFGLLPLKCPILEILLIDDCQEIPRESYKTSPFKQHNNLQLLCVAHNREALFPDCVIEMLKYANRKVLIDIRGHHFTEEDFNLITRSK